MSFTLIVWVDSAFRVGLRVSSLELIRYVYYTDIKSMYAKEDNATEPAVCTYESNNHVSNLSRPGVGGYLLPTKTPMRDFLATERPRLLLQELR